MIESKTKKQNSVELNVNRYGTPEIKGLGFVRPFSNSEKLSMACTRNYTLEYIEEFKTDGVNENFAYGSCWHLLLERILLRIRETDVFPTNKEIHTILSSELESVIEEVFTEYKTDRISTSDLVKLKKSIEERICLSIDGWANNWRTHIHPNFEIIDVEMVVYAPVSFNGDIFKSKIKVIKETYPSDNKEYKNLNKYRLLRSGENNFAAELPIDCISSELYEIEMPYYKIGKIDAVLLHREYNSLWVLDHKTTKSPQMYEKKTEFDLQLTGYCALLRKQLRAGRFDHIKDRGNLFIGGVIWDLCSSDITTSKIPKPLKSGKFSQSASRCPPSWLFKKAIEEHNLKIESYAEFYKTCLDKDDRFFIIKEIFVSDSEMDRLDVEDYSTALRLDKIRKDIEEIDWEVPNDWDLRSPRFTVCTNYSSCKFSTNCFANSKANDIFLMRQQKLSWIEYE